jgi:hypothetical protein
MAITPGLTNTSIALELGGKSAGWLQRVQPPGYEVTAVATGAGSPNSRPRSGSVKLTPVDADFTPTGADPLFDWALSLPRRSLVAMDGAILLLDRNYRVARRIEWTQGLLTEVRLPELDASSRSPFTVGLTWHPEAIRFAKAGLGSAAPGTGSRKSMLLSNFRISGLPFDGVGVVRVALPTVRAKFAAEAPGTHRLPERHLASVDMGEVRLEIGARSADSVRDWVAKVVGDGMVTDAEGIDFSIDLLDSALKKVLATIVLRGCALRGYAEFELAAAAQGPASVALRFSVGSLDIKPMA